MKMRYSAEEAADLIVDSDSERDIFDSEESGDDLAGDGDDGGGGDGVQGELYCSSTSSSISTSTIQSQKAEMGSNKTV